MLRLLDFIFYWRKLYFLNSSKLSEHIFYRNDPRGGPNNYICYSATITPFYTKDKRRRRIFIPNRTILVHFSGISGKFGLAMVYILAGRSRQYPWRDEPDMSPKCSKMVRYKGEDPTNSFFFKFKFRTVLKSLIIKSTCPPFSFQFSIFKGKLIKMFEQVIMLTQYLLFSSRSCLNSKSFTFCVYWIAIKKNQH